MSFFKPYQTTICQKKQCESKAITLPTILVISLIAGRLLSSRACFLLGLIAAKLKVLL
jgi:Na+-transporting NADH:ubiquinone oxidoreductase subunit NqrC